MQSIHENQTPTEHRISGVTTEPNIRRQKHPPKVLPASNPDEAITRAHAFLNKTVHRDGYWWGELESNTTMEAEYIMLLHIMGVTEPTRVEKVARHIENAQLPNAGWNMYYGGESDLSTSVECYTALKMAGRSPNAENMRHARKFISEKGGVEKVRVFSKIWLAMLGQWEWSGVPYLPPEIVLIPNKLPFNIYSFASWTRGTIVPMSVILAECPTWPLEEAQAIPELYVNGKDQADFSLQQPSGVGWERIFYIADRLLKKTSPLFSYTPTRSLVLNLVNKWLLDRQEEDGSWGGIQPPWVYSLIALKVMGYSLDDEVIAKGLAGFDHFGIDDGDSWRLQACVSPVWDTCLTLNALVESGVDTSTDWVKQSVEWLLSKEIRRTGDWSVNAPNVEPSGWAFEFANQVYPDVDDAAEVIIALANYSKAAGVEQPEAITRGIRWMLGMQSANGGWGSFDKDNTSFLATRLPFFDFGEVIDPPSVDVTAHVIEALAIAGWETKAQKQIAKAQHYIWSEQEEDGPWFGRWGINYIYGTCAVLSALKAINYDMTDPRVTKSADWIEAHQNYDGGWGETPASYANPLLRGRGESTASQTAWALIALMAVDRHSSVSVTKGIDYLLANQAEDGSWNEPQYTATGFPGYGLGERLFKLPELVNQQSLPGELPKGFMIKYHMYRLCWPLLALGRYRTNGNVYLDQLPVRMEG